MTQLCLSETLTNSAQVYREKKELVPYIILRRRNNTAAKYDCVSARIYVQSGLKVFCLFFIGTNFRLPYIVQTTVFYNFVF
jgi:hypothetical protein